MDWLIKNNIPVKKLIQEKGDLVVTSPGTISWRRSLGRNTILSWNIMAKLKKQITSFVDRYNQYRSLKLNKLPKIPMKSLFMRILNH